MTNLHLSQETIARIAYVAQFSGTHDIRYYLNGVCLQNSSDGFYAVATNGHVMAVAKLGEKLEGDDFEIIIQNVTAKIIASCKERFGLDLEHESDTKRVSIKTQDVTQILKAIEGKYPDWRRIIPQGDTAQLGDKPLGLSVVYLALLDKAMKAFKKHDKSIGEGVGVKYHGYSSPVVFEPEGVSGIKVLLMPRRV